MLQWINLSQDDLTVSWSAGTACATSDLEEEETGHSGEILKKQTILSSKATESGKFLPKEISRYTQSISRTCFSISSSIHNIWDKGYHCYPIPLLQKGSGSEWPAQVTQLKQEETIKYLKRGKAKGQREREEKKKKGVRDAFNLISSWCVC